MKKYFFVTIKETLSRSVIVEADSKEEADKIIDEIDLDSNDYYDRKVKRSQLSKSEIKEGWWQNFPVRPLKTE